MSTTSGCVFAAADVRRLILAASARKVSTILLVHDQGIYLMGQGMASGQGPIIYARGCHPRRNPDFWEHSRTLVGGDDFVERFSLEDIRSAMDTPSATALIFTVTSSQITLMVESFVPPSRTSSSGASECPPTA